MTYLNQDSMIHAFRNALKMIAAGHANPEQIASDALAKVDVESADSEVLVLRKGIANWNVRENAETTQAYDFRVTCVSENQFGLRISQSGLDQMRLAGTPLIDAMIEISEGGLPCIHLGNDPYDAPVVSIRGMAQGVFIHDGAAQAEPIGNAPQPMRDMIISEFVGIPSGSVYMLDTADKYAESISDDIRDDYRKSSQSRADVDYAIARLKTECNSLFDDENAMWSFLISDD